jgi:hypothetical protein
MTINLYYLSPWKVTVSNSPDYVQHNRAKEKWGITTNTLDVATKIYRKIGGIKYHSLPAVEIDSDGNVTNAKAVQDGCKSMWSNYISLLKRKAKNYLDKNIKMKTSLTVTAFDLALLGEGLEHIDIGYSIPVSSPPHGVVNVDDDDPESPGISMLCSESSIDILDPTNTTFTIGAEFKTLSASAASDRLQSGKALRLAKDSYTM